MTASALRAIRGTSVPRRLLLGALVGYLIVFAAVLIWGRPGLGLGQGFYAPIVLAGLATDPVGGALAGIGGLVLYEAGLVVGGRVPLDDVLTTSMVVRLVSYVIAGAIVGYAAVRGRRMLADSLHVLEDLLTLGRRDLATGVVTGEGFEGAINRRLASGRPFALLVGEPSGEGLAHDERARELARLVSAQLEPESELGRMGDRRFGVLAAARGAGEAREAAAEHERALHGAGVDASFGWAWYPQDGRDTLSLYGVAIERLHARRYARGEWAPTAAGAGLVHELDATRPRPG